MRMKMSMEHISQKLNKRDTLARREKKRTRFFVDNEFLERGYAAKYRKISLIDIYCVLAKHANYKSQLCFPSIKKLIEQSGVKNRNTVLAALKKLEELNIIKVFHSKGRWANKYLMQDPTVWLKEDGITDGTVEPYQGHHGIHRI